MSHLSQKIHSYIYLLVVNKVVSITFIILFYFIFFEKAITFIITLDVRYYILFAKLT